MRIVPATCPVCSAEYDPLRSKATRVVDGKVRAYCSNACKDKAQLPPPELLIAEVGDGSDDHGALPTVPSVWSRMSWKGAVGVGACGLAVIVFGGKLIATAPLPIA